MTLDAETSASETVSKVTTDRPKNPGRQEWGRKLGKMQKELKAKKLELLSQKETSEPNINEQTSSYLKWEYIVAVAGLIFGGLALYYQKKSYEVQVNKQTTQESRQANQKRDVQFSDF